MKSNFAIGAGAVALGLALWIYPGKAQGPLWDTVNVNLPYTVTVGDHVLQPGEYKIQQLRDAGGNSRVLLIYSDNGMKFETSAMTIPALDPNTARDTRVILHHIGPDYYFDKIWIQGKDYGYEFPLPSSVKAREKEMVAGVSVPAQYSTTQTQTETTTATTTPQTTEQTAPPPQPETTAQATPPPEPTPSTPAPEPNANREETPAPPPAPAPPQTMPATSAGWLMMLLGGGTLSSAGLLLRRKR